MSTSTLLIIAAVVALIAFSTPAWPARYHAYRRPVIYGGSSVFVVLLLVLLALALAGGLR